jgi:hypothetical protein
MNPDIDPAYPQELDIDPDKLRKDAEFRKWIEEEGKKINERRMEIEHRHIEEMMKFDEEIGVDLHHLWRVIERDLPLGKWESQYAWNKYVIAQKNEE